ncbi:hypothetical protein [Myroides odoratus]|uniref:hypothetical protein n=1 Tax=Myroides odoratus TaxID=256 RepID=UPI00333FC622
MIKTIKKIATSLLTCFIVCIPLWTVETAFGQVIKSFEPRKSTKAPLPYTNVKNYNLQGDFTMIGNTNLTLKNYTENGNNSDMVYVDIDNVDNTINSSSANLVLPGGECTEVVYAGLYWSGRAHDIDNRNVSSSPTVFNVESRIWSEGSYYSGNNIKVTGATIANSSYTITKSREGERNNYYTRFVISSERTGLSYTIDFNNGVIYILDPFTNQWNSVQYSYSNRNNIGTAVLSTPLVIRDGNLELKITSLERESRINRSESDYVGTKNNITFDISGNRVSSVKVNRELDKRKVKFKANNDQYINITAKDTDIYYPTESEGVMYSAYADVTDYVRQHGSANYFVADMALSEGNGGATGFYGGWGMVIIYKNTSMKWKDITVFDGHGYMVKNVGSALLPVEGFRAAQHGEVNVKMGMMAGEGDVGIPGDYFHIANTANRWVPLKHGGNTVTNFFNSSIYTGGNARNPNLVNNTGIDIAMFDLDNTSNSIIANNQSTTNFAYGTSQDTYIIYNIVFAVDAYVPEIIGENKPIAEAGGVAPINNGTITPGQRFGFELDVYNKGTEAVKNSKIEIPVPANLHFAGANVQTGFPVGGGVDWLPPIGGTDDPNVTAGGTIVWDIGVLPLDQRADKSTLLAKLKYYFKVSDNCVLLSTNVCGLEVRINGKISGTGVTSGTNVSSELVRDYGSGACAGPVYDDFMSTISLSVDFLQNCNPPVENNVMQFKAFCDVPANGYSREEVIAKYPVGAKFFSKQPTTYSSNDGLITGDFPVNPDGSKKLYYVMTPGMGDGCYARLEISVDKVVTEPTTKDSTVCLGEPIVLENALSQIGVTNQYALVYFAANGTTKLEGEPNPTTVGVHNYFVAEGKDGCVGPKKPFKITINALPVINGEVADMEICSNFDVTTTVQTTGSGLSYTWEYSTTGTTWQTLTNTTFSNKVVVTDNTITVKHADTQLNGTKLRLKVRNSTCTATSNVFEIKVKDCPAVTNPMLLNSAIQ